MYEDATDLFERIGTGRKNAIFVPNDHRAFTRLVAKANNEGDCIINIKGGYYRPDPTDPEDVAEVNHYLARELHRARSMQFKRLNMKKAFFAMCCEAGVTVNEL